jgi:hypothetical protein
VLPLLVACSVVAVGQLGKQGDIVVAGQHSWWTWF